MSQHLLPQRLETLFDQGGLFEGKYRFIRRLGEGGFAIVIHAEHKAMGRDVALKFLKPHVLKSHPEVGQRFLMEVRVASRLTSPYTVTIFDFGETQDGVPFMALEYVKGKTLDVAIEKHGPLSLKRSLQMTLQILESLGEAHTKNIIHRDLKPANLMVSRTAGQGLQIKVLDFGVAKLIENTEEQIKTSSKRKSTQFIGTPRYMSPEQILGQKVSAASDLYSLGLILYEMVTGKASIPGENIGKIAQLHLDENPLPLEGIEGLPHPVAAIIRRATARKVEERYQSAAEFQQAVEAAIEAGKAINQRDDTQAGAPPAQPARSRTSDVFAGRAYVEHPEVDPDILRAQQTPATGRALPQPRTTASSPSRPSPPEHTRPTSAHPRPYTAPRSSSPFSAELELDLELELELELEPVRQTKRNRQLQQHRARRKSTRIHQTQTHTDAKGWAGSLLVILLTSGLSFFLLGALLTPLVTPLRITVALLPLGLSLIWAMFSQNAYPDRLQRWLISSAKRSATILCILLVALALVLPDVAARSLTEDALWFAKPFADPENPGTLFRACEAFGRHLGTLYRQIARLLPWG